MILPNHVFLLEDKRDGIEGQTICARLTFQILRLYRANSSIDQSLLCLDSIKWWS